MKLPIKSHLRGLKRTPLGETGRGGFLRLDLNEGAGLPEGFVKMAASGLTSDFLSRYPEYHGLKKLLARHNHLRPENISLGNGSDGVIKNIFEVFVGKGDRVLMTDPTFAMYPIYCRMFQARARSVPYRVDLAFPYDEFSSRLVPGVRLAILVNPNNPTGTALAPERVLTLARKARRHGTLFLVDEAYFYFCPKTLMPWVGKPDNLIVLRTFSKLCGLAAGRLGYAAASPDIVHALRSTKSVFDVNSLSVFFAERLLREPALLGRLRAEARDGKEWILSRLRREGVPHVAGEANFILIECGPQAVARLVRMLARRKVLVSGGFPHEGLRGCIRVTTGSRSAMAGFWRNFLPMWRAACR